MTLVAVRFTPKLRKLLGAALAAGAVCASCPNARADVDVKTEGADLTYRFRDHDDLGGTGHSAYGQVLKLPPIKPVRVLLIRPRTSFVPEMFKSVERN